MPVQVQCPNPNCREPTIIAEAHLGPPHRCFLCGGEFTHDLSSAAEAAPPLAPGPDPGWSPSRPTALAIGSLFASRYQILSTLGRGGQGAVYLARDTE